MPSDQASPSLNGSSRPASVLYDPAAQHLSPNAHLPGATISTSPIAPTTPSPRNAVPRKPVDSGAKSSPGLSVMESATQESPSARIMGPRPMHATRHSVGVSLGDGWKHRQPDIRRHSAAPSTHGSPIKIEGGTLAEDFPLQPSSSKTAPLIVQIIRREPASSNQWNIGRLVLRHEWDSKPTSAELIIDNPGYEKFTRQSSGSGGSSTQTAAQTRPFSRQLGLGPVGTSLPPFVFSSPWNTDCAFSTSLSGRSFVCIHYPAPSSPPGKARTRGETVSELRPNLPSTSRLAPRSPRAWQQLSAPSSSPHLASPRSFLSHHIRDGSTDLPPGESDDEAEEDNVGDGRLDLTLGRERAGGGLRGRTAKLGKLVITGKGAAMLDLVVAANMGVWWSLATRS